MANNNVITHLKQKGNNSWQPYYFGSAPNYIKALKNCSLNNLEEELLLGVDSYLETYEDNEGNTIIEKYFCADTSNKINCYKIESIIYKDLVSHDKYYFEHNELIMKEPGKESFVDDALVCTGADVFEFDSMDTHMLNIKTDISVYTVRKDTLFYIDNEGRTTRIAEKETKKKFFANGKIVLIEDIDTY